MSTKLSDIQRQLASMEPATAWGKYLVVVAASLPFWQQAIEEMAALTKLPADKAEQHRAVAQDSFALLHNWYFEQTPYVKARRNEIDSAISFIRNSALRHEVATVPAAASARNLAGVLRILLYLSVRDYHPQQYPQLMASGLHGLAAAKSVFPVDLSDLVSQFARPNESPIDNIDHLTDIVQRGASHYHFEEAVDRLKDTLEELWANFDKPEPWNLPVAAWEPQKNSLLVTVHNQAVQDFHNRD